MFQEIPISGGYSFYTGESAIEQCLTVTYGLKLQPVFAFVGGVQIGVMPEPLVSVEATVCWPKQRPDGQDRPLLSCVTRGCSCEGKEKDMRCSVPQAFAGSF